MILLAIMLIVFIIVWLAIMNNYSTRTAKETQSTEITNKEIADLDMQFNEALASIANAFKSQTQTQKPPSATCPDEDDNGPRY